jgi:alkanesulfonate monooxygenase
VDVGLAIKNFVGPTETPDIDELYRYATRAEELGFESLWAWDHVILGVEPSFPIIDALSMLTAIAVKTSRIKLGTGILVLPLRNPTVLAKQISSLDHISMGRFILGTAVGWYAREFGAVGVDFKRRGRLMDRNLDLLIRLLTEDKVRMKVDEFDLRDARILPHPVQQPRPPILIGGYVDAVFRRIAKYGDGWMTYFYTAESTKRTFERIKGFAAEAGRDPSTLTVTNQLAIYVGKSREAVHDDMRHWLTTEWDIASWSESTIEHAIEGSVDECVAQLQAHVDAGVDRIILLPYRYQPEQVEIIAREVLPCLKS